MSARGTPTVRARSAGRLTGLPAALPPGETMLWQGAPQFRGFARRGLHLRKFAIYFAVLVAWYVVSAATSGSGIREEAIGMLKVAGLALAALGLIVALAWLVCRTTVYTITNRRIIIHYGVAFPMTLNLPFAKIESASLRQFADGSGDVPVCLSQQSRIAYLILWPHARPWRMARAEPSLRAVRDAARVAQLLARALAASAEQSAQPVAGALAGAGPRVRATATA